MKIIGLGHYSRTGKDTFANAVVEYLNHNTHLRAKKIPFAWKLKDICHQLYAWDGLREAEFYDTPEGEKYRNIPLPTIGKTPVQIWIDMGTPAVRQNVYIDTWVDYLLRSDHDCDVLLVPDVRFPNEVKAIRELDGWLAKVVRPGFAPRNSPADLALINEDPWDFWYGGDGDIINLRKAAGYLGEALAGRLPMPSQLLSERERAKQVEHEAMWSAHKAGKLFSDGLGRIVYREERTAA